MAQISLAYSADQINAAIAKINSLVGFVNPFEENIEGLIVQLYNGSTAIFPRTKAEAVVFSGGDRNSGTFTTLDKEFDNLKKDIGIYSINTPFAEEGSKDYTFTFKEGEKYLIKNLESSVSLNVYNNGVLISNISPGREINYTCEVSGQLSIYATEGTVNLMIYNGVILQSLEVSQTVEELKTKTERNEISIYDVKGLSANVTTLIDFYTSPIPYPIRRGDKLFIRQVGANGALLHFGPGYSDYIEMTGESGTYEYIAQQNFDSIFFYGGSSFKEIDIEIYKNQGIDFAKMDFDYKENLKYHFGKLNLFQSSISLSSTSVNKQPQEFFVKAGNTFRIELSGLTEGIALFAFKEDGTRFVLFGSLSNGVYESTLTENITSILWHSNIEQVANVKIDIYDKNSYVAKCAISSRLNSSQLPFIISDSNSFATEKQQLLNGAILRKRGFDVPLGSTGNQTMIEFHTPKISDDCDVYFDVITNIPASNFDASWSNGIVQESDKIVRFKIGKSINTQFTSYRCIVFVKNQTDTNKDFYFRLSRILIHPQTTEAYELCVKRLGDQKENLVYEVCKDFTSETTGYGDYRFNSILDVNLGSYLYLNKPIVRVMPGVYDEFALRFPLSEGETGTTWGIKTKAGVTYESFDIYNPELTVLKWDGHEGLSDDQRLNITQAMARCIFHIDESWNSLFGETIIQGFKIISANVRYCVHAESSGYGVGKKWILRNSILEWNGCPYVDGYTGRHLGIGISNGEEGLVENVLFTGSVIAGIGGHDNGFPSNQTITPSSFLKGPILKIKGCNLGGGDIYMNSYAYNNFGTINSLIIEGCSNVNRASLGFEGGASTDVQTWKGFVVNSDITQNDL